MFRENHIPYIFTNYVFPFVGRVAEVFVKPTSLAKIAECGIAVFFLNHTVPRFPPCYLDFPAFLVNV